MGGGFNRGARIGGRPATIRETPKTEPEIRSADLERVTGLRWIGPIDGRWSAVVPGEDRQHRQVAVLWKDWGSLGWIVMIRRRGKLSGNRNYGDSPESALKAAGLLKDRS